MRVPAKAEAKNVNQLLVSSLLNYMSDTAQGLARKAAFEDPDRAITFLSHLKDIKQGEHDAHVQALRANEAAKAAALKWQQEQDRVERTRKEGFDNGLSHYHRFKDLGHELEKKYNSDLEKEQTDLGKSLYKNRPVYEHIQKIDPDVSQIIKQLAQERQLQQKIREMDRGGMSL